MTDTTTKPTNALGRTLEGLLEVREIHRAQACSLFNTDPLTLGRILDGREKMPEWLPERIDKTLGVIFYALAWVVFGDEDNLPKGVRDAARSLADHWRRLYGDEAARIREALGL
jgi:hypothetical protein